MAIDHQVDPHTGCIRFVTSGAPSADEQREHWLAAVREPGVARPLRVLDDRRGVEQFFATSEIFRLSSEMKDWVDLIRGARIAMVVSHPVTFGMVRIFEARTDTLPFEIRAFYDPEDAEAWLDGD